MHLSVVESAYLYVDIDPKILPQPVLLAVMAGGNSIQVQYKCCIFCKKGCYRVSEGKAACMSPDCYTVNHVEQAWYVTLNKIQ